MSLLEVFDRLELTRVEFFIKEGSSIIVEAVESLDDTVDQTIFRELRETGTGMTAGTNAEMIHGLGSEVALIAHRLHDALIDRAHPLSPLSCHIYGGSVSNHMLTDMYSIATKSYESCDGSLTYDCKSLGSYL